MVEGVTGAEITLHQEAGKASFGKKLIWDDLGKEHPRQMNQANVQTLSEVGRGLGVLNLQRMLE